MNDGKLTEQTEALPLAETTSGPTANPSGAEDMDRRRRRLIRGAVGIAPVVLTLRSGGLAASSICTPAANVGVVLENGPTGATGPGWIPSGVAPTPSAGSVCVEATSCPGATGYIQGPITKSGNVVGPTGPTNPGTRYYCNGFENTTVAILSAQGATSLVIAGG